ncbi:MAG TPA: hypothetical protein VF175_15105 [Lacipirellula sp.]
MPRCCWFFHFVGAILVLHCVALGATAAAEQLLIETVDGRTLSGEVDERSDDNDLWLRMAEDNVVLTTPIAWSEISKATLAGDEVAAADLRERRADLASAGPRLDLLEAEMPQTVVQAAFLAPRTPRVRNLDIIAAGLVNLDRDVEPDGLSVTIVAVGFDGAPVAVRGTLRAELHGERRSVDDPTPRFAELGRWTDRVQSEDFVEGAATYCLPFRSVAPQWEFDVMPDAVLTVQLGATGHGNYSASAPVVLRHFNPLRDELQQWRGTRFLPNEVRGAFRGEQAPGMWLWWGR